MPLVRRGSTKEMMQPSLIHLFVISLVPSVRRGGCASAASGADCRDAAQVELAAAGGTATVLRHPRFLSMVVGVSCCCCADPVEAQGMTPLVFMSHQ